MKTIAIIDNSYGVTGAFKAALSYGLSLSGSFRFIYIIPKGSSTGKQLKKHNFKYHELYFVELGKDIGKILTYLPALVFNSIAIVRIIREESVGLVHSNDLYNMSAVCASYFSRTPLVTHARLIPSSMPNLLIRIWLLAHKWVANNLICVSKAVYSQISLQQKVLIYDFLTDLGNPRSKDKNSRHVKFVFVGNYTKGKGQDLAIKAFGKAHKEIPSMTIEFYGSTFKIKKNEHYKESLQNMVSELKLEGKISFHTYLQNVQSVLETADVSLNFSESESFSFTCLEAIFAGVPLIATRCGGPEEMIEHGVSGLLVGKKNIDEMSKAMIFLAESPGRRKEMSEKALDLAKTRFDKNKSLELLKNIYQDILV